MASLHAAVRDPENRKKLKYLDALAEERPGSIRYFKADLLEPGSYAEAMAGCEVVFHTASPFTTDVQDPMKELIEPARLGTRNVLEQANETPSVKRVVVTSVRELGLSYRPLDETVVEFFQQMVDNGVFENR